jgi:ferredoxin
MLTIDPHACLACSGCIAVCPEGALAMGLQGLQVDHGLCTLCRICLKFCPVAAIDISYEEIVPQGAGDE